MGKKPQAWLWSLVCHLRGRSQETLGAKARGGAGQANQGVVHCVSLLAGAIGQACAGNPRANTVGGPTSKKHRRVNAPPAKNQSSLPDVQHNLESFGVMKHPGVHVQCDPLPSNL